MKFVLTMHTKMLYDDTIHLNYIHAIITAGLLEFSISIISIVIVIIKPISIHVYNLTLSPHCSLAL